MKVDMVVADTMHHGSYRAVNRDPTVLGVFLNLEPRVS